MRSALWQVDPAGVAAPRRLTRSAAGEAGGAEFLPDGSLLFTSSRPDPDAKPDPDRKVHALWLLPAGGGEARLLAAPEGGVDGLATARERRGRRLRGRDVPRRRRLRGRRRARQGPQGRRRRARSSSRTTTRSATGITGSRPAAAACFAATVADDPEAPLPAPRDLQPDVATLTFEETGMALAPDGSFLVAARARRSRRSPTSARTSSSSTWRPASARVLTPGDAWYDAPAVSPDGRAVAAIRTTFGSPDEATPGEPGPRRPRDRRAADARRRPRPLAGGPDLGAGRLGRLLHRRRRRPPPGLPRRPRRRAGHAPDGRGRPRRPLSDARTGDALFALCSTIGSPPRIVRLDARMRRPGAGGAGQRDRRARDRRPPASSSG